MQQRMDAEAEVIEREHILDDDCWCNPRVEKVELRRCDGHMWTGPGRGARCPYPARRYQRRYDLSLCGYHTRAYLQTEPMP